MAGFRTFATGEVLTSANVNNFLMKQSVMVFADDAARTAALGAEVTEGMLTFNKDTGALEVFDGSDFVPAGAEPNLVAVKSAIFTGIQTDNVAAQDNVAVTDLTITHALADAGNKLIISAYFGVAGNSVGPGGRVGLAIHDGTGLIAIGDDTNLGDRTRIGSGGFTGGTSNEGVVSPSVTFVHEPGDTSSRTYTVRAINIANTTETVSVNRNSPDTNNAFNPRAASGFVLQEVSA